jgi:hypothetical protein
VPVGFLLIFWALLWAAIDPQFLPTQMDMWKMLDKFRVEVIDSSSGEESDHTTQTMATVAASILREYNAS